MQGKTVVHRVCREQSSEVVGCEADRFPDIGETGDVTQQPYVERRALLEGLGLCGPRVAVSPAFTAADGVDGRAMLELARLNGQEGVVAKRLRSRYRPGERSPDWIKQPLRVVATVLVCGWVGTETRLEALLLAAPPPSRRWIAVPRPRRHGVHLRWAPRSAEPARRARTRQAPIALHSPVVD